MAQVYDPETGDGTDRWTPGRGHDRPAGKASDPRGENAAAGDPSDPRGDLRQAEQSGAGSSTGGTGFSFNRNGDGGPSRSLNSGRLSAAENSAGMGAGGHGLWSASDQTSPGRVKRMFQGKNKKRAAIGLGIGSATAGGIIVAFLALIPLRIESFVQNIENTFDSTSTNAISKETDNLFDKYITKKVLPNLNGACHSTVDRGCKMALKSTGSDPISQMYNAWREDRLEQKLATNYNLAFAKKGNTYFVNTSAGSYSIGDHPTSIFDMHGTITTSSRMNFRVAINESLQNETLWKRVYFRFRFGKFISNKYADIRCIVTCRLGDKITDNIAEKKLAAKAYIVSRVIEPASETYSLIIQCVFAGGCNTNLGNALPGDPERESPAQQQIQQKLEAYAAKLAEETGAFTQQELLDALVREANEASKVGFKQYFAKKIAEQIASTIGGDEAGIAAGEAAEKAVPIIGWTFAAAKLVNTASQIGPLIRYMGYAANAAAAVQLYEAYSTVASEMKSGNTDATELGSFTSALSTNLDGSNTDQSDATQTPLYQQLYGNNSPNTASLVSSVLPSDKVFADSSSPSSSNNTGYLCNDGKPVPTGQLVCPEEKLDSGNHTANEISSIANSIPVLPQIGWLINKVGNVVGGAIGTVFQGLCYSIGLPECPIVEGAVGNALGNLVSTLTNQLIVSPFSDHQSGGRTGDMMIAGGDVAFNSSCQEELGCAKLSNQQVADIRSQQTTEQKTEFDNQSVFARMFSTSSPYSFVSRLAMVMPTSLQGLGSNFSSFLSNPLGDLGNLFADAFSGSRAFAATPAASDPFGIPQNGYPDSQIPADPPTYWNNNCVNGPMAKYDSSTGELDISAWLNNDPSTEQNGQPNTEQDPNTGQQINLKTNPCLLIQATVEADGGMFDDSLIPADEQNSDNGGTGGTTTTPPTGTLPTGSAQSLAQQLLPYIQQHKISCNGQASNCPDIQNTANGVSIKGGEGCEVDALNSNLLGMMLELVKMGNTFVLSAICSDHHDDGGATAGHSGGKAADFNYINGVFMGPSATTPWTQAKINAATKLDQDVTSFMPKTTGFGQIQCHPTFSFLSGFNTFPDSCNHQHIQVE